MEAVVTRVIIKAFKEISNCHQNFEMKHIYEIVNLAKNSTGKKINLTNNIICKNSYGDLIFKVNEKNIIDDKISEVRINKNSILNDIVFEEYNISFQIINNKNKVEFSKNNLIKLSIRDNVMAITSNTDKGNVYEEVNLELTGEYLDIAFNSRYFLEGLKNIDSEEIFIEFTTNINPCIIRPADDVKYTYLLLPVRISSNI